MTAPRWSSETLARALAHPTRRRILQMLADRVGSPREIAEDLGAPIGRVSHHVRWLAQRKYLELVRTEPRRGAVEHFYRATVRAEVPDQQWNQMPARQRRALADALVHEVWGDVLDARETQAFEADDVHLSRTLLELDDRGRRELADALQDVVRTALRIQEESTTRGGDRKGRRSKLAVLHFDVDRSGAAV